MVAVEVGIVARAPGHANHAALALVRHLLLFRDAWTDQQRLLRQPRVPWKAGFAFARVFAVCLVWLVGLSVLAAGFPSSPLVWGARFAEVSSG